MRDDLTYRVFMPGDEKRIAAMTAGEPLAVELKHFVRWEHPVTEQGALWLGSDKKGRLRRVVFDNSSYTAYFSPKGARFYENTPGASVFSSPEEKNRLCVMVYAGKRAGDAQNGVRELAYPMLRSAFEAIYGTKELPDGAREAFVRRCRAVNHGSGVTFGVVQNGEVLSTGSVIASDRKTALIGDIFTLPACRCRGYAALVLDACVAWAVSRNRTPVLLCREEMYGYYRKRGFKRYYG